MEDMTWEQRFWAAWQALVEMEKRAEASEAEFSRVMMQRTETTVVMWQRARNRLRIQRRSKDAS